MSEKEKKTLEVLTAAVPKMSDFEKGKICGYGEAIAEMREAAEEKKEEWTNVSNGKRNDNGRTATAEP